MTVNRLNPMKPSEILSSIFEVKTTLKYKCINGINFQNLFQSESEQDVKI